MLGPNVEEILVVENDLLPLREKLITFSYRFKGDGAERCHETIENTINGIMALHDFCQRLRVSIQSQQPAQPRPSLDDMGIQLV